MKRHFYSRGRKVELDELEDVLAIKSPPAEPADRAAQPQADRSVFAAALRDAAEGGMPGSIKSEEARAFERAGWSFIRPTPETRNAMRGDDARELRSSAGPVFRREDGQLVIGSDLITVKLLPDYQEAEAREKLEQAGLEIVRQLKFARNLFEARVATGQDPIDVANALQENEVTIYSEPVLLEHIDQRQPFVPSDPQYRQQWQWQNNGLVSCSPGADISAEEAWEITRGSGVRIAVIDNGFDVDHEDLSSAVVAESGYFKNQPGGDADFKNTLTNFPDSDHGTFCAGIAAARANNGKGGCGAAPEAELILVGTLNDQVGSQVTLARAIAYAADPSTEIPGADPARGAHVIACSLGPNLGDWTLTGVLEDALTFAVTHGRDGLGSPIFWATSNGNFPVEQDQVVSHEAVIAVGRSTCRDSENDSAFGPKLEFLAPGVSVYSTRSGNNYGFSTGTSFAAPLAAGVGALLLAYRSALTWEQVRNALRSSCDKIGGVAYDANGHHTDYGYGRINALKALQQGGGPAA